MTADGTLQKQGFQIENGAAVAGNGVGLRALLRAGHKWLEGHVNVVNGLNVFPVPDGDTGANMFLTMRAALQEAESSVDDRVGAIAAAVAHGALMGARGNSGVILSQFLEGLAAGLADHSLFTAEQFAQATRSGVDKAYQSVMTPVEGTILTVAREVSEAACQSAKIHSDLVIVLADMVQAGRLAQARTPELLPVLREAGVTDSGGQGFLYILEGALRFLRNEPVDIEPVGESAPGLQSMLGADDEAYGYDVQFLIDGQNLDVEEIRARIDSMGWSTVVVGSDRVVKVHVHAGDPGAPLSYGASQGALHDVVVKNMEVQARQFVREHAVEPLPAATAGPSSGHIGETTGDTAIICVAPGDGLAKIFRSLGVTEVLPGGPTMNPSPQEFLEAINRVEANNVLLLPNDADVILAAERVRPFSSKNVRIVATKSIPQGIAALLSFNYQADLETNSRRMLEESQTVETIEVTRATRSATFNGFLIQSGQVIGLLNNTLVSVGREYDQVTLETLALLKPGAGKSVTSGNGLGGRTSNLRNSAGDYEIVTVYFGQDCTDRQARTLAREIARLYPGSEVEVHQGGQPHYHYIVSLE